MCTALITNTSSMRMRRLSSDHLFAVRILEFGLKEFFFVHFAD